MNNMFEIQIHYLSNYLLINYLLNGYLVPGKKFKTQAWAVLVRPFALSYKYIYYLYICFIIFNNFMSGAGDRGKNHETRRKSPALTV